jgi:CBS domain-containing protein
MTPIVRTAKMTQSLVEAAALMRDDDVGSIPVVDNGRLIGIVTDRDIVVRAIAEHRDIDRTTVDEVASHDPVTVGPEQDLNEALELMAMYQVRRLPVVEDGRLVGMLAQADVAMQAKEKKVGETLHEISKPRDTAWSQSPEVGL